MNKQPFLIIACCWIFGILLQENFPITLYSFWIIITIILGIFVLILFGRVKLFLLKKLLIVIFSVLMGVIFHFFNSDSSFNHTFLAKSIVTFNISKKLNSNHKSRKYEIEAWVENQNFNAILYLPKDKNELDFIHVYQTKTYINKVETKVKDFQFDYGKYLKRKGIEFQIFANKDIKTAQKKNTTWNEILKQKRLETLQNINYTDMSSKTQEFLKGIILADRTEMDAETINDFNRSGLTHFLAISGTHMAIIFGLLYFFLINISPLGFRKYAIVSSLAFIWLFGLFIGFGNSVLRSCIMLTVYFIYVLLQRKPDLLHALSISALIILLSDTYQIFDVGFQMSFLAVLGIYWLNKPILRLFPIPKNWISKILFSTISISVSAQLAVVPLMILYFHQFSFISIVANFLIVPLSELVIVFSFLMVILIAFKWDFVLINTIYDLSIQYLLKLISWLADFEFVFFENFAMSWFEVIILFIFGYFLRFYILKRSKLNFMKIMLVFMIFLSVRMGFNLYYSFKNEVLVHKFYNEKIISVKQGNIAHFWFDESLDKEKVKTYLIQLHEEFQRIKCMYFLKIQNEYFFKIK